MKTHKISPVYRAIIQSIVETEELYINLWFCRIVFWRVLPSPLIVIIITVAAACIQIFLHHVEIGMTLIITTDWAEVDVLDNGTGAITIIGTVSDRDDATADNMLGRWDLSYNTANIVYGIP